MKPRPIGLSLLTVYFVYLAIINFSIFVLFFSSGSILALIEIFRIAVPLIIVIGLLLQRPWTWILTISYAIAEVVYQVIIAFFIYDLYLTSLFGSISNTDLLRPTLELSIVTSVVFQKKSVL